MELITLIIVGLLIFIAVRTSEISKRLEKIEKFLDGSSINTNKAVVNKESISSTDFYEVQKEESHIIKEKKRNETQQKVSQKLFIKDLDKLKKRYEVSKPSEPTYLDKFKEKFKDVSFEELLFGNILLKIAIVAFILGIGFFLKYSIDKDWIPIWGRVLIGISVGIAMLIVGIKMIKNQHKLFSETLFGGGIAVLYLSIFAAYAIEDFKFVSSTYAFVLMVAITILAGLISVRFDAKSTAIFGLIGGFATPFLLSSGSGNYVGLLSYMLMLTLGVFFIAIYKKWQLLSWLAFIITSLTILVTVWETSDDFTPLLILYTAFFVIYSIVPFINHIRNREDALGKSFVILFWMNFMVAILSFLALFIHYDLDLLYFSLVTITLAAYLLIYSAVLTQKVILLKNLFYIVLAQAISLLLVTPAFVFDGSSLTTFWSIESLMLLWIAIKSNEKSYAFFAFIGFIITVVRYLLLDIVEPLNILGYPMDESAFTLYYLQTLAITSFFVIGSLFVGFKLLKKSHLELHYTKREFVILTLFLLSFIGSYLVITLMSSLLLELYHVNLFSVVYMLIIALFAFLLYHSDYKELFKVIFYLFLVLLTIGFIHNILNISEENIIISLLNFLVFMGVSAFIYLLVFRDSNFALLGYSVSTAMLIAGVGLLFLFLNVEVYYIVKVYYPLATKFAITLLWMIFGMILFVYGIIKEVKIAKMVGTLLIILAILKAFFIDLANLSSIYRIILFLILGVILFGLSYFYQSKNKRFEEHNE
jgi:uncharacterized membrane protein